MKWKARFFNKKRKDTPEPPQQPALPGKPTDITAGSSGSPRVEDIGLKDDGGSQTIRLDKELGLRASALAIDDIGDELTNESAHNTGSKPAERPRVAEGASEVADRFNPLKVILRSIPAAFASDEKAVTVENKIEGLLSRIVLLENHFDSRPSDVAEQRRRDELRRKFDGIKEILRPLLKMPRLPTEKIYGTLEDLREVIVNYQVVRQREAQKQQLHEIDAAEATLINNFRTAQGAEYRHGNRNGCLKGTRAAVLDEIESWAGDFDKPPVYWLNGLAGTGKSTVAQTIAERAFADGQLGASFFCSRDFEDRSDLRFIFPTLAVQLARKYTDFRSLFVSLARSDPGITHDSLYNQMHELVVCPLKESNISTIIIIDALDECKDDEPASAFLSVLGQFVAEIPEVKFLVTGRPEPRIREGFRLPLLADATDVFVLHEVESSQVDTDIWLFFKQKFSELARRRRGLDNWPTEEQLGLICKRAGGLFVYAVATVKFIDKQNTYPRTQLDLLLQSPESSREGKAKFNANTTLDSLYTSILQGAFGDDGDPDNDPKVRSVLGAMILAANPLSPSSIARLLGFGVEEIFPLLSSAQSLLILQEDLGRPVQPFHKSFPDFITDPNRCTNPRFHISPPDHHFQVLIACLNLMDRMLERNTCRLPDGALNLDVKDLKERIERYIDPALRYACRSWHTHLIGGYATSVNIPKIMPALHQLLENKFLSWLEVLSVLGDVKNAVDALQAAADLLEESPTLDLVNDCCRFVTQHFEIISTSSPHIYHSALVLTPSESIVQKLYKLHAKPFVRVVHGIPPIWDSNTAAATSRFEIELAAWSPCNKFIATSPGQGITADILDSATLQRLQSLEFSRKISSLPQALAFSPDSRMLTSFVRGYYYPDTGGFVVSWDLQTGGVISAIEWRGPRDLEVGRGQIAYFPNGRIVASLSRYSSSTAISIYDVVSGVHMHDVDHLARPNPDPDLRAPYMYKIWTHGESLRFATPESTGITIWDVGLAPGAIPTEVEKVTSPDTTLAPKPRHQSDLLWSEFHPASSRLAFIRNDIKAPLRVWDSQASKSLLRYDASLLHHDEGVITFDPSMTFSSDGRFFACGTLGPNVFLWRESPTGYTLLERLTSGTQHPNPLLSPNGESIILFGSSKIQSWHIKSFTASNPARALRPTKENFILEFFPDRPLAVATRKGDRVVAVLDLNSGAPLLTIDTSIPVCGLRPIGKSIVVIGEKKAIVWDLPGGNFLPNARMKIGDSTSTIAFHNEDGNTVFSASISLDFQYIALVGASSKGSFLDVHCISTGQKVHRETLSYRLWFAPGDHDIWCASTGEAKVFTLIQHSLDHTKTISSSEYEFWGCPWGSSLGHEVTDDRWIVGMDGKRLLMLPPLWYTEHKLDRLWNGKFFALLHGDLAGPVVLELEP